MTYAYLDTSAAAKLLVDEAESEALAAWISQDSVILQSTLLLETELRRAAQRYRLPQVAVSEILEGIGLIEIPPGLFREAGLLPDENLRSLDALHLAGAIYLNADVILTYDRRLHDAATAAGLKIVAPR